jgi:glycosyltransferase involved in cell wall biosynthesis
MAAKLKIAIIHFGFFYSGGGERLVLEEISGLRKMGFEVECYSPVVDASKCHPDLIKKARIRTLLPQFPFWFPEREAAQIIMTSLLAPVLALKFRKFDLIIGANQPGPWIAWTINKILRKPYIAYLAQPTRLLYPRRVDRETGFWLKKKMKLLPFLLNAARPLVRWADDKSVLQATKVLTNGEYISGVIKRTYSVSNAVCPAGAHPVKESELVLNKWEGNLRINKLLINKPYILLTNRHFPQKRFEHAISAMPMVLASVPEASLIITGEETEYTKYLKEVISNLELGSKVHFVGLVSEKDLKKLYLNAACYIYTSPQEDFGMGVVEAMAHGTVPIAWRKGGPRYIIRGGETGLLAKAFQISSLSHQLIRLLKNKELNQEIGSNAWKWVAKNLSFEVHNRKLRQSILEAHQKHGGI